MAMFDVIVVSLQDGTRGVRGRELLMIIALWAGWRFSGFTPSSWEMTDETRRPTNNKKKLPTPSPGQRKASDGIRRNDLSNPHTAK